MNKNFITKHVYQGGNQDTLEAIKRQSGFKSQDWLTFLQAKQSGLKIKRGSKGTRIMAVTDEEYAVEGTNNQISKLVKYYTVFNLDQTEKIGGESNA